MLLVQQAGLGWVGGLVFGKKKGSIEILTKHVEKCREMVEISAGVVVSGRREGGEGQGLLPTGTKW